MTKKIKYVGLTAAILTLSSNAFAVSDGFFFGLQMGQSTTSNTTQTIQTGGGSTVQASPSNSGLAERLFFGYNINPYAAWEFGFTHYGSTSYNVPGGTGGNPGIHQNGFDIIGKGTYPFDNGFGVFGKGGLAIMRTSTSASIASSSNTQWGGTTTNSLRPLAGVGISYDLTQNWVTDLSISHVFSGGSVKNTNLIALGISYHIVDLKCGQFLC